MSDPPATPAERLRVAFEMYELGEKMKEQQLRREHAGASDAEIHELLMQWLVTRPGAEHGDAWGRPISVEEEPAGARRPSSSSPGPEGPRPGRPDPTAGSG